MSTKISQLTSATDITASDLMQIVDVEDGVMAHSGTNKKITAQLLADDLAGIVSAGSIATSKLASGELPSGVTVSSANIVNGTIVNNDISSSAAIAGSKISPSFTTNSSVTVDSSSTALSITQSGAGANLSANGSFSQFLNDGAAANLLISTAVDSNQPAYLQHRKYRGTHASPTAVQDGDALGSSVYYGYDGNSLEPVAFFGATVDGAVSDGIIPTRFGFSTENSSGVVSEKMRITSAGNVGIGTTNPTAKLNIVDATTQDALRITQTGTGNALVVEDSSPDVTPLVIDSSGRIITNHATPLNLNGSGGFPRIQSHAASGTFADSASAYVNWQNGTGASGIFIAKSRGGAVGTYGAVVNSDSVGEIRFACDDGEKFNTCAKIQAEIDGGVGINDIPCRLTFGTVPSGSGVVSERMRITSSGNVGIATTTPSSKLHVAGDLTMSSATVATSATAGTNGDVPAQVAGYLVVNINGTARKIPYYA